MFGYIYNETLRTSLLCRPFLPKPEEFQTFAVHLRRNQRNSTGPTEPFIFPVFGSVYNEPYKFQYFGVHLQPGGQAGSQAARQPGRQPGSQAARRQPASQTASQPASQPPHNQPPSQPASQPAWWDFVGNDFNTSICRPMAIRDIN